MQREIAFAMKRFIKFLVLSFLTVQPIFASENYVVTGCVMLNDTAQSPAQFASVFIPGSNIGTITDTHGNYTLHLPESDLTANGRFNLEYAFIGYAAQTRSITLEHDGDNPQDTVVLDFQPIMLPSTYVTDGNMDPADYILSKVWERADVNRNRMKDYSASIKYSVSAHQLNLLAQMLPKSLLHISKTAVAVATPYGPIFNYCTRNQDLDAAVDLNRRVVKGRAKDKGVITSDVSGLPSNVQRSILSAFDRKDLFDLLYGKKRDWSRANSKYNKYTFEGTYQYGDYFVDVLKCDKNGMQTTLHIVEDIWGILSVQFNDGSSVIRCESRFVNGDILMPVSLVCDFSEILELPQDFDIDSAVMGINGKDSKKATERMRKILKEHKDDLNPYIVAGLTVQYDVPE